MSISSTLVMNLSRYLGEPLNGGKWLTKVIMSFGWKVLARLLLVLLTVGVSDLEGSEMLPEAMFCCIEGISWVSSLTSRVLERVTFLGSSVLK